MYHPRHTRILLDFLMPHKGGTSDTMGQIAPELSPLMTQSAGNVMDLQNQEPVSNFLGYDPQQMAGASPLENYGLGGMYGAENPTGIDALALQDIMRSTGYAGAGPTTGSPDFSGQPDIMQLLDALSPQRATVAGVQGAPPAETAAGVGVAQPGPNPTDLGGNIGSGPNNAPGAPGQPPSAPPPSAPTAPVADPGPVPPNTPLAQLHGGPAGPAPSFGGATYGSGKGVQWQNVQSGAFEGGDPSRTANLTPDQRKLLMRYSAIASNPQRIRELAGDPSTWDKHYATGANGLPVFNGFQYTGAQHEYGGNDQLSQHFIDNGMSDQDFARFLYQGNQSQLNRANTPEAKANLAAGKDIWGNVMPKAATGRTTTALGKIINPGTNPNAQDASVTPPAQADRTTPTPNARPTRGTRTVTR